MTLVGPRKYFADAAEVYRYIGAIHRAALEHPETGTVFANADFVLQLNYTDPASSITLRMRDPVEVVEGGNDPDADVTLTMPADIADRYWRGEYNMAIGISRGTVVARGPLERVIDLVPATRPLFPVYRRLVADKDRLTPPRARATRPPPP